MDYKVTFDDILLVPQYSDIRSRSEVDLTTNITPLRKLSIPIISANMDTVTEFQMASALHNVGGCGIIHRFMSIKQQTEIIAALRRESVTNDSNSFAPLSAAIGVKEDSLERARLLVQAGCDILVIDVAHGDHIQVVEMIKQIKKNEWISRNDGLPVEVIAGNVATSSGTRTLFEAGADGVKVGIGGSGICSTRLITGHGVPQFSALVSAVTVRNHDYPERTIIADGGIRQSGDIVKALAVGADCIMAGSLFAGTDESPGEIFTEEYGSRLKIYRGMASAESNEEYFGKTPDAPEGIAIKIPYKGPVKPIIQHLTAGIRSGLSYSGCRTIPCFKLHARWNTISQASATESQVIGKGRIL